MSPTKTPESGDPKKNGLESGNKTGIVDKKGEEEAIERLHQAQEIVSNEEGVSRFRRQRETYEIQMDIFEHTGVTSKLAEAKANFDFMYKPYAGNPSEWIKAIKLNKVPGVENIVASDTEIQQEVTGVAVTKRRTRGEGKATIEAREISKRGSSVFENVASELSAYGEKAKDIENGDPQDAVVKEKNYAIEDDEVDMSYVDMALRDQPMQRDPVVVATTPVMAAPVAPTIPVAPTAGAPSAPSDPIVAVASSEPVLHDAHVEAFKKKKEWEINGPIKDWGEEILRPMNNDVEPKEPTLTSIERQRMIEEQEALRTPEETQAFLQKYLAECRESQARVEQVREKLAERKKGVLGRLGSWGIKAFERYEKIKSNNQLLIGVLFAGASVATGGTTAMVTTMLAAGAYGRGFYQKILKAEEAKGNNEVNRPWLAARSILYGGVIAIGTSMLLAEAFSHVHVDTEGIMNDAKDKLSSMKDGLRNLFGISPDVSSVVPVAESLNPGESLVSAGPDASQGAPDTFTGGNNIPPSGEPAPGASLPQNHEVTALHNTNPEAAASNNGVQDVAPAIPEMSLDTTSPINLNETYVMGQKDNTDSILQRVLATVDDAKNLTEGERLAMISKFKTEWSTWLSGASTPNWALKEMLTGTPGTEVHHLDHVRDSFITLLERAKN